MILDEKNCRLGSKKWNELNLIDFVDYSFEICWTTFETTGRIIKFVLNKQEIIEIPSSMVEDWKSKFKL